MHKAHKMHRGEIVFHLIIPAIIFASTFFLGYYIVILMKDILKIA